MDVKNRKQKFNQQEDLLSCFIRSNNGVVMAERNTNSFSNYFTSPAREEGGWWMLWCLGYEKMCKDWIVGSERVAALPRVPIAAVFGRVRGGRCVWGGPGNPIIVSHPLVSTRPASREDRCGSKVKSCSLDLV